MPHRRIRAAGPESNAHTQPRPINTKSHHSNIETILPLLLAVPICPAQESHLGQTLHPLR